MRETLAALSCRVEMATGNSARGKRGPYKPVADLEGVLGVPWNPLSVEVLCTAALANSDVMFGTCAICFVSVHY